PFGHRFDAYGTQGSGGYTETFVGSKYAPVYAPAYHVYEHPEHSTYGAVGTRIVEGLQPFKTLTGGTLNTSNMSNTSNGRDGNLSTYSGNTGAGDARYRISFNALSEGQVYGARLAYELTGVSGTLRIIR